MSLKILIVDDSPLIRCSLRRCFEQSSDWEVCGEAENGLVAIAMVKALKPRAIILDLSMPVMNGLEAAREIAAIAAQTVMLMFTMYTSDHFLKEAQKVGIRDVLSKSEGEEPLLKSLKSMLRLVA